MTMLANRRKADKRLGDDVSLTRFIKEPGFHKSSRKVAKMTLGATGTRFPYTVKRTDEMTNILVSGHSNIKLGRDVRKAKFRGYWIYSLSLEERATCPTSCQHWTDCYGNAMPFAKRINHTDRQFLPMLERELEALCAKKLGVLVRLHALGDFYSTAYVSFWSRMMVKFPNLAIYGYTARRSGTAIGWMVHQMNQDFPDRCMIRFSDGGLPTMSTVSIGDETGCPSNAFICPEQTGKTRCCATCGACWSTAKNVAFMEH